MQASLPREKRRGFFLKSTFAGIVPGTTICSNSNIFNNNNFVPATIFSMFFKPLKNREAS